MERLPFSLGLQACPECGHPYLSKDVVRTYHAVTRRYVHRFKACVVTVLLGAIRDIKIEGSITV